VDKGKGVRFGLTAIKGLGEGAINAILEARTKLGGKIPSLHALCEELDLRLANKRVFEALVKAGACDSLVTADKGTPAPLNLIRARLFAAIDGACEHGNRLQRNKDLGQVDLFGGGDAENSGPTIVPLRDVPPWSEIEQLTYEKETLGLYWTGHPMDRYADDLREYGSKTTADLVPKREAAVITLVADDSDDAPVEAVAARPDTGSSPPSGNGNGSGRTSEDISIGGIISGLRPLKTRKGDRMCVFTLDDAAGSIEVVVFPETFKQSGHYAENGRSVLVHGRFERDDDSVRILATEIVQIEMVRERLAKSVAIRLSMPPHGRATFERLLELLAQHKGDRKVAFVILEQDRHLRVTADVSGLRVRPSERLVSEVEKICGSGSVSLR
jgi:DNA polymerase-3 subunit alpha